MTDLDASQTKHARGIIAAAQTLITLDAATQRQIAVIATATALTEAGLRMLASANVPESQKYPHDWYPNASDGLGHDHASCGMFQQQTGYAWTPANNGVAILPDDATMEQSTMGTPDGWGTPAELMDAETCTRKFIDALLDTDWQSVPGWQAAQNVQHSTTADGSNYEAQWPTAEAILNELWPAEKPHGGGTELTQEEPMNAFVFAYKGAIWCSDTNLKSKRGFATPDDYDQYLKGKKLEGAKVISRKFSDRQCSKIPTGTGA